jgi:hypothetical protein
MLLQLLLPVSVLVDYSPVLVLVQDWLALAVRLLVALDRVVFVLAARLLSPL